VLAGKELPRTVADFQTKMPRASFAELTAIDPLIYDKTQNTMTAVSTSCAAYHTQHLGKLVTVALSAVQYANMAIKNLVDVPDLNLKDNLNILLDPKYVGSSTFDTDFEDARGAAVDTLAVLKKGALTRKTEVNAVIATLIAFKDDTVKQLADVNFLTKQYSTGPVTNNSKIKTPYLTWLNAELKADLDAVARTKAEAQEKWGAYEKARDTAIGVAFVPFGWIGSIVKGIEAENLKAEYNNLNAKAEQYQREYAEGAVLVGYVAQLIAQFDKIDDLMDAAIDAMVELSILFSKQADCYTVISDNLDALDQGVTSNTAKSRRGRINGNIDATIAKLLELKALSTSFADAILREIQFATDDVSAPA